MGSKEFLELKEYDPSRAFIEAVPRLVRMARRAARTDAISYRNVKVGAAIMLYDEKTQGEAILSGSNVKAKPEDEKYCAEMDVIDQANELGYTGATGLVIAGPSASSVVHSISGTATSTLHPCDSCQEKMLENPHIVTDDTLIFTVSSEENVYQVHAADELRRLYTATETRESLFMELASNLDYANWGKHVELYDDLKSRSSSGTSSQYLARIALENIIDFPD